MFFQHAIYVYGHVSLDKSEVVDHAWVTEDELSEYLTDPKMLALAKQMIVADS